MVHQQQDVVRTTSAPTATDVNAVNTRKVPRKFVSNNKPTRSNQSHSKTQPTQSTGTTVTISCKWCDREKHNRQQCPTWLVTCSGCNKLGHYQKVCRSSASVPKSLRSVNTEQPDELFLSTICSKTPPPNQWLTDVRVNDRLIRFRIDTGADATIIPAATYYELFNTPLEPIDQLLLGPNRAKLNAIGRLDARLQWHDTSSMQPVYVLSDVHQPLLGLDAIIALRMIKPLDALNVTSSSTTPPTSTPPTFDPRQLYADRFTGLGCMSGEYSIKLKPDAQPYAVFAPRRVPVNLMQPLKAELEKLEREGVIQRVDEPTSWCAPIVVVPKRTAGTEAPKIRLCVDLSRLNDSVEREKYSLPTIDQLLAGLAGATVFSKLDCNSAFNQVMLSAESAKLTTFISPFGRWNFRRLPYGISSASELFQKKIHDVLQNLEGVACIVDDILVYGRHQAEHDVRLRAVLDRLRAANVTLNEKCQFSRRELKWAGHIISGSGISPDPDRVKAVVNMKPPNNVTEVRCFFGMVNQLAKFSELSAPIRDLLRKDRA